MRFLKWLAVPATALVLLVLILVGNTLRKGSVQVTVEPMPVQVDVQAVAEILSASIRIPTVSEGQGRIDRDALAAHGRLLEERFPLAHEVLTREAVGGSLLYTWRGSDPSLPAGLLLAHQDVVPVGGERWAHDPFSGDIAEGHVWGRGALDDKQNIVAILTAVETLHRGGFQPRRTIYLVFGHDEEMGGHGAEAVAARLRERKVVLDFVLDEGGMVADGVMGGLEPPVALIGIAEKGYVSVVLRVRGESGHSSMPPPHSSVGLLAQAIVALESRPMPPRVDGPSGRLFDTVGPEMVFGQRVVMANRWLLDPVLVAILSGKPSTNATIRTTQAVTMVKGSSKDNVLPDVAEAVVNYRIVPGDDTASVLAHVREVVGPGVEVGVYEGTIASDPSPVSRSDGPAWDALQTAIRQTWPEAVVSPFLFIGATDARAFASDCERVWRFSPMLLDGAGLKLIHGADERISLENLESAVGFYVRFLTHTSGSPSP